MRRRGEESRETKQREEWVEFEKVWNQSDTLVEVAAKCDKSLNSIRSRAAAMRKRSIFLKEMPMGRKGDVFEPTPDEIEAQCKVFLSGYSDEQLQDKIRCDQRNESPRLLEFNQLGGWVRGD